MENANTWPVQGYVSNDAGITVEELMSVLTDADPKARVELVRDDYGDTEPIRAAMESDADDNPLMLFTSKSDTR